MLSGGYSKFLSSNAQDFIEDDDGIGSNAIERVIPEQ